VLADQDPDTDSVIITRGVNTRPLLHVRCQRGILGTLLGVLRPQGVFHFILVSSFRSISFFSVSGKIFAR
jgi:hypothetical protein